MEINREQIKQDQIGLDGHGQKLKINLTARPGILTVLHHPQLSWKAKALALTILCNESFFANPTNDKEAFLQEISKEGIEAIRSGIKEIQQEGVLQKTYVRNTEGRNYIIGSIWTINFMPKEV